MDMKVSNDTFAQTLRTLRDVFKQHDVDPNQDNVRDLVLQLTDLFAQEHTRVLKLETIVRNMTTKNSS